MFLCVCRCTAKSLAKQIRINSAPLPILPLCPIELASLSESLRRPLPTTCSLCRGFLRQRTAHVKTNQIAGFSSAAKRHVCQCTRLPENVHRKHQWDCCHTTQIHGFVREATLKLQIVSCLHATLRWIPAWFTARLKSIHTDCFLQWSPLWEQYINSQVFQVEFSQITPAFFHASSLPRRLTIEQLAHVLTLDTPLHTRVDDCRTLTLLQLLWAMINDERTREMNCWNLLLVMMCCKTCPQWTCKLWRT